MIKFATPYLAKRLFSFQAIANNKFSLSLIKHHDTYVKLKWGFIEGGTYLKINIFDMKIFFFCFSKYKISKF